MGERRGASVKSCAHCLPMLHIKRLTLSSRPSDERLTPSSDALLSSDMEFWNRNRLGSLSQIDFPSGNIGKMREGWTNANVGSYQVPEVAQGPCVSLAARHLTERTVHQDSEEPVGEKDLRAIALVVINRWKFSAITKAFDSWAALTLVITLLVLPVLALSLAVYCSGQLHQMRWTPCLRPPCPVIWATSKANRKRIGGSHALTDREHFIRSGISTVLSREPTTKCRQRFMRRQRPPSKSSDLPGLLQRCLCRLCRRICTTFSFCLATLQVVQKQKDLHNLLLLHNLLRIRPMSLCLGWTQAVCASGLHQNLRDMQPAKQEMKGMSG
jgi:hypothetical protein